MALDYFIFNDFVIITFFLMMIETHKLVYELYFSYVDYKYTLTYYVGHKLQPNHIDSSFFA